MPPIQKTIEAINLSKSYGRRTIVSDISLSLEPGQVMGLIGPNGAGKTTIIRMLVGLVRPTSGTVRLFGKDLSGDFEAAIRNVGAIIESPDLYKYMSGRRNLRQAARMHLGVTEDRINEVAAFVNLSTRIDDELSKYSLGMRQRLGIARTILHRPKLLILDEPTNGLDPEGMYEFRELVRTLSRREGMSVLVSSHLLHDVQSVCDSVTIINAGEVAASGTIAALLGGAAKSHRVVLDDVDAATRSSKRLGWTGTLADTVQGSVVVQGECGKQEMIDALHGVGLTVSSIDQRNEDLEQFYLRIVKPPVDRK